MEYQGWKVPKEDIWPKEQKRARKEPKTVRKAGLLDGGGDVAHKEAVVEHEGRVQSRLSLVDGGGDCFSRSNIRKRVAKKASWRSFKGGEET